MTNNITKSEHRNERERERERGREGGRERERERERERVNPRSDVFSFQNLLGAYYRCRKTKRKSSSAAKFEINFERELLKLEEELQRHTYESGRSICFAITDPKLREVWAADFRDRVVHHLLVSRLEPIWEKMFIFHSYACRREKGAHKAICYLNKTISPSLFFLQADIQSFFVSINKDVLSSLVKKYIKNPEIVWLTEKIIFHDPTKNYFAKGDLKLLASVPPHKSLFGKNDCGLPIGNLTSQFFANIYLNELDQFVKHSLKCRYYFRYMDDLLLLHSSKEQLLLWKDDINNFVETRLKLKLHPKKQILQPAINGINFCGYIIKPGYALIRRRTVKKLKNKLWQFNKKILDSLSPNNTPRACDMIFDDPFIIFANPEFLENFRHIFSSINSVYGFFKHADCYNLQKSLFEKHFGILKIYLIPADENYGYFVWDED
ncbi:MAG: reverse transcriptase/maturase family protein [bacterium]|nr:reverse transcriptase/maturase family protein [bacterium]